MDVVSYVDARTSPPTLGTPRCSDLTTYAEDSSLLGHGRLRRGLLGAQTSPPTLGTPWCSDIASDAGDSSLLGARSSPATSGTPRYSVLGHHQRPRGLPCCSDLATSRRCAIKLLHAVQIRVLILGSTSGVLICACQTMSARFQTSFSLTLLQDSFFIFQQARGLSGHTSPCGECALFSSRGYARGLATCSAGLLLSDPSTT